MQPPCAAASSSSGLVFPSGIADAGGQRERQLRERAARRVERPRAAGDVPLPADVRGALDVRHYDSTGTCRGGAVGVVRLGRRTGGREDAEHLHLSGTEVLERVDEPRGQVEARARRERCALVSDMEGAFAGEDVADLVVEVEVVRRAAGRDVADELRHRRAAVVGAREEVELAAGRRDAALARADHGVRRVGGERILDEHREDEELVRVVDAPRGAARDEGAGARARARRSRRRSSRGRCPSST